MTDQVENFIFNMVCQQIMTSLFLAMSTATQSADNNVKSSFWYNVMEFLSSGTFSYMIDALPQEIKSRPFLAVVTSCLAKHFVVLIGRCLVKQEPATAIASYSTANIYSEIHRFVGWAIWSRRSLLKALSKTG